MIESQIFLTPAEGTRVVVPLKDPMPHGSRYVTRWHITDPMRTPFGHKILLNLTFNYSVSAELLPNINIHGIEILTTRVFRQDMVKRLGSRTTRNRRRRGRRARRFSFAAVGLFLMAVCSSIP